MSMYPGSIPDEASSVWRIDGPERGLDGLCVSATDDFGLLGVPSIVMLTKL